MSGRQNHFVCRRLFASDQWLHQFKDAFLSRQPSRFACVETQWTAKFDQQVRCSLCFWIALKKSHSSCFRMTVWPCLFSQSIFLRYRCHGKHVFCSFREGHKHLLLQGNLTEQPAKYPPHCRDPDGSMTRLRLVWRFRCELRFFDKDFGGSRMRPLFVLGDRSPVTRPWHLSSPRKKKDIHSFFLLKKTFKISLSFVHFLCFFFFLKKKLFQHFLIFFFVFEIFLQHFSIFHFPNFLNLFSIFIFLIFFVLSLFIRSFFNFSLFKKKKSTC